jgi:hypothetical protein
MFRRTLEGQWRRLRAWRVWQRLHGVGWRSGERACNPFMVSTFAMAVRCLHLFQRVRRGLRQSIAVHSDYCAVGAESWVADC